MLRDSVRRNSWLISATLATVVTLSGCNDKTAEMASQDPPEEILATLDTGPLPPMPQEKPVLRPASAWTTNQAAFRIIEEAEGLRLHAYHLAGQVLIGYGHAVADDDDETAAAASNLTITASEARELLQSDVAICEDAVGRLIDVNVTRNQFSAMVALCYNVGQGRFGASSIVRYLNEGDTRRAADAFLFYTNARINNEKVQLACLSVRRMHERSLFLTSPRAYDFTLRRI